MKKQTTLGIVIAGALLFGALDFAGADSNSVTDPSGDSTGGDKVDIVAAKVRHTDGGKTLTHQVKLAEGFSESPGFQVLLQMNVDADKDCDREIIWPPGGTVKMTRCGEGAGRKRATVTHPKPDTLKFTLKPGAIGDPDKYGWRFATRESAAGADYDAVPSFNGYIKHRLR
jgi:hypothetical protein